LLSIKKQHVKSLKENLDSQQRALQEFHAQRQARAIPLDREFRVQMDLETLSLPALPINVLQTQIFDKLSVWARPIMLATTLTQTVRSLNASLETRNQLIASAKAGGGMSVHHYFGLPQGGQVNRDYPSIIDAIHSQTDDGIYFSHLLTMDLMEHGTELAKRFKKRFGEGAPRVNEADFSNAEKAGLMPNPNNYSDWTTMVKKRDASA
jgi:hypothetical protein